MAELVDAVVLEATTSVWEFESPLGHQMRVWCNGNPRPCQGLVESSILSTRSTIRSLAQRKSSGLRNQLSAVRICQDRPIRRYNMEIKFKKFEPATPVAKVKVSELVQRGGTIIEDRREYVEVKRLQSIAHIDQYGRVEWRAE